MRGTLQERMDAKIDRSGGPDACHPWMTASVGQWGHPIITLGRKTLSPRVLIWEAAHGPKPKGKAVTDTCNNTICCNLKHLELRAWYDDEARFWENVKKADGDACWEWTASLQRGGYAQMKRKGKKIRASRFAYEIVNGPIASPLLFVCHTCDNPKCVRADHLFLGTAADNNADMMAKGRYSHGEAHSRACAAGKRKAS